jgi:hypothetical protein
MGEDMLLFEWDEAISVIASRERAAPQPAITIRDHVRVKVKGFT